jgi:DNA-binding GntR family transcriptional regulator
MATEPVNPHLTKSEFAYQELRRRILDGELRPGERLLLRPLAEDLRLSVMPVRDALRMLERDGLVTSESHRGTTVSPISSTTVYDMISMRLWLEVLAIREAVPRHDERTLERVDQELANADAVVETGDGLAYAAANRALHQAMEAPAPAPIRGLVDELWERLWQARRRMSLFSLLPGSRADAQREHAGIVAAIRSVDADAAAELMARHRESTLASWRRVMADLD